MIKRILAVSALGALIFVNAQEGDSRHLEEVEIQGRFLKLPYKKTNENVEIISAEDIHNSASKSIDELLQGVAGVDLKRRGSNGVQSDLAVRGGNFEQVLVLLNNVRMNDAQTGHNSLNIPVDLASVERIEIVKGPAARRFGNGASAVVNIITKPSAGEQATLSASGGDFETYQLGLSAGFGGARSKNLFQASTAASSGYRYNTDYNIRNVFYQNETQNKLGKTQFQAGFSEKKFGANGFYASPAATEQYEELQASVVSLGHEAVIGKLGLNAHAFWRRGQDMYLFNRAKPEIYRNMHIGNNVGGDVNASYRSSLGTTGLGVEFRKEYLSSSNLGDRERTVSQVFFEHSFSLLDNRLNISPGISWSNISNAGDFFYPGIDVGFDITDQHKIFANVAKTHRIPTFTDLYYTSKTEAGNPDLKPESEVYYEAGYRFMNNGILAKVSFFGRESTDAIDWVKHSAEEKWQAMNIGETKTQGFETEFSQQVGRFIRSYSVGYTYLDKKLTTSLPISRYLLDNLRHQFVARLSTAPFARLVNEISYRYNQRADGYDFQTLDDKISYNWPNFSVYLLANNITNSHYNETFGVPMPGRWFHAGFSLTMK